MPKQQRNKQFVEIEEKIRTDLLVHSKSTEKEPIHFDEFSELKEATRIVAQEKGLSLSEWFRWLNYRYLSVHGKIPVELEPYFLLLWILALFAVLFHTWDGDSTIYFVYAQNLLRGHGLCFNPGYPSASFSSPDKLVLEHKTPNLWLTTVDDNGNMNSLIYLPKEQWKVTGLYNIKGAE